MPEIKNHELYLKLRIAGISKETALLIDKYDLYGKDEFDISQLSSKIEDQKNISENEEESNKLFNIYLDLKKLLDQQDFRNVTVDDINEDSKNQFIREFQGNHYLFKSLNLENPLLLAQEQKEYDKLVTAGKKIGVDLATPIERYQAQEDLIEASSYNVGQYKEKKAQYNSYNIFRRFLSHFVPNSWTKLGRLRDEMDALEESFKSKGIDPNYVIHDFGKENVQVQEVVKTNLYLNDERGRPNNLKKDTSIDPFAFENINGKSMEDENKL